MPLVSISSNLSHPLSSISDCFVRIDIIEATECDISTDGTTATCNGIVIDLVVCFMSLLSGDA